MAVVIWPLLSGSSLLITCFMQKQSVVTHLSSTHVTEASFSLTWGSFNNSLLLNIYLMLSQSCSLRGRVLPYCACSVHQDLSSPPFTRKTHKTHWEVPALKIYVREIDFFLSFFLFFFLQQDYNTLRSNKLKGKKPPEFLLRCRRHPFLLAWFDPLVS